MKAQHSHRKAILVIRLGAMGDILHALPAVASLKKRFPGHSLAWLISRKWLPLVAGNPSIDELVPFGRNGFGALRDARRTLRSLRPEIAIDFQGLLQSALAGRAAHPARFFGFDRSVAREPIAVRLYTDRIPVTGPHRIERNLQLAAAAGASHLVEDSWLEETWVEGTWIPEGVPEAGLPVGPFVLASPFAGWASKQWPTEFYDQLGCILEREGLQLVLNVSPDQAALVGSFRNVIAHSSSLSGLIYATRRAEAVLGVDSGPLHLAAALKKPGVALFGPTDPAQTGPFKSPMAVLREADTATTYKRGRKVHASMASISVEQVAKALLTSLTAVTADGL